MTSSLSDKTSDNMGCNCNKIPVSINKRKSKKSNDKKANCKYKNTICYVYRLDARYSFLLQLYAL